MPKNPFNDLEEQYRKVDQLNRHPFNQRILQELKKAEKEGLKVVEYKDHVEEGVLHGLHALLWYLEHCQEYIKCPSALGWDLEIPALAGKDPEFVQRVLLEAVGLGVDPASTELDVEELMMEWHKQAVREEWSLMRYIGLMFDGLDAAMASE